MHFNNLSSTVQEPMVSVVMNCHNGEKYLSKAIDSIYAQTYKNWEIIFLDNASVDNSSVIANSYDDKLIYIKNEALMPLYEARNLALDHCNGTAIAFLDCDDIWLPKKLELQMALFVQGAKFIYGGYEIINAAGTLTGIRQETYIEGQMTSFLIKRNIISIGCVVVDSNLIKSYRFNSRYDLLGDFDLWIRLSVDNKFCCVPQILELSRQHSTNLSDLKQNQWLQERRHFYKNFIKNTLPKFYPQLIFYILKTEIKGLVYGK